MSPKTAAVIATLSAIGGLLAFWPQLKPVLDDALLLFGFVILHARAQAAALAATLGCALSMAVPHYLDDGENAKVAKRRMGLASSAASFTAYLGMVCWDIPARTWSAAALAPHDFVIALILACIGWPAVLLVALVIYRLFPKLEPGALKDDTEAAHTNAGACVAAKPEAPK